MEYWLINYVFHGRCWCWCPGETAKSTKDKLDQFILSAVTRVESLYYNHEFINQPKNWSLLPALIKHKRLLGFSLLLASWKYNFCALNSALLSVKGRWLRDLGRLLSRGWDQVTFIYFFPQSVEWSLPLLQNNVSGSPSGACYKFNHSHDLFLDVCGFGCSGRP